jgi:hypothetical protein
MSIPELWLPILVSAIAVWVLSAIVWIVLPHHRSDYAPLPDEDEARAALKGVPPGLYSIPYDPDQSLQKTPEGRQKFEDGPVAILTFWPKGLPAMGKTLVVWFGFCVFIGVMTAYVLTRTMSPGGDFYDVWQVAATVAWLGFGTGAIPRAIWFGEPWPVTVKHLADALLYALVSGAIFAGLW